jgi:hypothetical protein
MQQKIKIKRSEIFAYCVGFFCSEELPSDWEQKTGDADQGYDWLEENACEAYQHMTGPEILEEAECMQSSMEAFLQEHQIEVVE